MTCAQTIMFSDTLYPGKGTTFPAHRGSSSYPTWSARSTPPFWPGHLGVHEQGALDQLAKGRARVLQLECVPRDFLVLTGARQTGCNSGRWGPWRFSYSWWPGQVTTTTN